MEDKPDFAFEKKIGVCESFDDFENRRIIFDAFQRLFVCMKETNDLHKVSCEFFRLDYRPQTLDEQLTQSFPIGSLVMDMKWGSKKELEQKKDNDSAGIE